MRRFSIAGLSVLASISSVITSLNAAPQTPSSKQGITLKPINIVDYEASMGLQRRGSHDLSVLEPKGHTDLVYGSPHGKSSGK